MVFISDKAFDRIQQQPWQMNSLVCPVTAEKKSNVESLVQTKSGIYTDKVMKLKAFILYYCLSWMNEESKSVFCIILHGMKQIRMWLTFISQILTKCYQLA